LEEISQKRPKNKLWIAEATWRSNGQSTYIYGTIIKLECTKLFDPFSKIITLPIIIWGDHIFESEQSIYIIIDKSI
jgi:hypothetical protein